LASGKKDINESDITITMKHLLSSIDEIVPAFGNTCQVIQNLLPVPYVKVSNNHNQCYDTIVNVMGRNKNIKTILIQGDNGSGKTGLMAKIANDVKVKYTKFIRTIDTVLFDEFGKVSHINDIISNAYISDDSLVVIDDLDIVVQYAKLDHNITFSNKCYQTILTFLKTSPQKRDHKIILMMSCTDRNLYKLIGNYFDYRFQIGNVDDPNDVLLQLDTKADTLPDKEFNIRELINI
jgi:vesicle-fusing ATPase